MKLVRTALKLVTGLLMAVAIPFGFLAHAIAAGFVAGWVFGEEHLNLGASQANGSQL